MKPSRCTEPFRLSDLYSLKTASQPAVSPDGKRVAFVVQGFRKKENDRYQNLWVSPTDGSAGPHRLTRGNTSDSSPAWSPDGRYLAFISTREHELDVAAEVTAEEEAAAQAAKGAGAPKPGSSGNGEEKPKPQLWVLDMALGGEPRQLTRREEGVEEFCWAPDGKSLAFISRDPDPAQRAYLESIRGRGPNKDKGPLVIGRVQHKHDRRGYLDDVRTHLFVVDLATREVRQITRGDCDETGPRWSPDGRWILVHSNRTGDADNNHRVDLWLVPAGGEAGGRGGSRAARRLTFGDVGAQGARWSPDGRHVAFVSAEEPENSYLVTRLMVLEVAGDAPGEPVGDFAACVGVGWSSVGGVVPDLEAGHDARSPGDLAGHARVYPVPLRRTPARVLTAGLDRPVLGEPVWLGPDELVFLAGDRGQTRLARVRLDRPGVSFVYPVADRFLEVSFVAAGGGASAVGSSGGAWRPGPGTFTIVLGIARPSTGLDLYALPAGELVSSEVSTAHKDDPGEADPADWDRRPVRLTALNQALLDERATARYERIEFRNPDGDAVEAIVAFPPGFDPAAGGAGGSPPPTQGRAPLPVLVNIHGGPMAYDAVGFQFDEQYWAGRGYLVLMVNYRGSVSYGERFCSVIRGDWGPREHDDVMAGVDEVIRRGWGDPKRLFCTGFSQGGIMTNWAVGHTDRFRAAVSEHGMWDYVAAYGTDDCHLWWQDDLGVPWQNPEQYRRISPMSGVAAIRTPLLITAGEVDWRCPLSQAEQLYLALKKRGVPTGLVIYQGEHHAITRPCRAIDRLRRVLEWLADYGGLPFEDDSAKGYPGR